MKSLWVLYQLDTTDAQKIVSVLNDVILALNLDTVEPR